MMDVPSEAIYEDLEGICEESISSRTSIIERYIVEEAIDFCLEYMSKANFIGVFDNCWPLRRTMEKSLSGVHVESKSRKEVMQAHLYK